MNTHPSTHPKKVLLVDDEPHTLKILLAGLKQLGEAYLFDSATSGLEALEKVKNNQYDLVITDYMMPGMSGLALAQSLRQSNPDVQVVMMTAHGSQTLGHALEDLEIGGYLNKPFSLQQIREIVRDAVGRTAGLEEEKWEVGTAVAKLIRNLQIDTNARATLLISGSGFPIQIAGQDTSLDMASISALVAANFMAATELARLLGNESIFKSSYHEGPDYDIYAYDVDGNCLLAVIFGSESKAGMVRYYTSRAVAALQPLLEKEELIQKMPHIAGFSEGVSQGLNDLFGE